MQGNHPNPFATIHGGFRCPPLRNFAFGPMALLRDPAHEWPPTGLMPNSLMLCFGDSAETQSTPPLSSCKLGSEPRRAVHSKLHPPAR
jgi:hypothetical protein